MGFLVPSIIWRALALTVLLGASGAALAQSTPQTIPGLEHFNLPGTRAPTPTPSPTPSPSPRATQERVAPPAVVRIVPPAPSVTPHGTSTPRVAPTRPPASITRPAPAPRPTPERQPPPAVPIARAVPTPTPRPVVVPTLPPDAAPAPVATPTATMPLPEITPVATATDLPPVDVPSDDGRLTLRNTLAGMRDLVPTLAIGGGVVVLLGLVLWFVRRRRGEHQAALEEDNRDVGRHERFDLGLGQRIPPPPPADAPVPEPPLPPPAAPPEDPDKPSPSPTSPEVQHVPVEPVVASIAPVPPVAPVVEDGQAKARARLDIAFTPRRAGTNLTAAAVEYDLAVRNSGAVAATRVRLDVRLLSAGAQQDALINALFAEPIARSITSVFDLLPGAEVQLGGMGILPRDMVVAMTIEGRELFVPVMTVNLTYDWAGGSGQIARSFVIGIERGGDARMGAFRLDAARMFDQVGALEYTIAIDR